MDDALDRIIDQAEKALRGDPIGGLENFPLHLYGKSPTQLRLGNIIAIATTEKRREKS
jgi:hypothetical protein